MIPWRTGKPHDPARRSHINYCVHDSTWESNEAFEFDKNEAVEAWVKNDHLGFDILYVYKGVVKKYRPDFLIRLTIRGDTCFGDKRTTNRTGQRKARPNA